jgi:hypothetical protein
MAPARGVFKNRATATATGLKVLTGGNSSSNVEAVSVPLPEGRRRVERS